MTNKEDTFAQRWADFISLVKPGTFTQADRTMAFCFYTWGFLNAARPAVEALSQPSELAKLGV